MRLIFEFEVDQVLRDAFRAYLDDLLAGSYERHDKAYLSKQIDEVMRKPAEEWSEATQRDLSVYLLVRAGFQSATGYCCEDFDA
jgi:hypothetical protein